MKNLIRWTGLIFALVAIFFVFGFINFNNNIVFAATTVSGTLSEDTVWTKANSPYLVSDFIVPAGVKLTIEPGVVAKFGSVSNKDEITVKGELYAKGTATEYVNFTSYQDDSVAGDTNGDGVTSSPAPGDWMGIIVRGSGLVNLDHTVINYGGYTPKPVLVMNILRNIFFRVAYAYEEESEYEVFNHEGNIYNFGGTVHITNSVIQNSSTNGIHHKAGVTTVTNTVLKDNYYYGIFNDSGVIINAKNNWWGNPIGPYNYDRDWELYYEWDKVSEDVDFTPWLTEDPTIIKVIKKNPVIIIPGILSSYLNRNDDEKTEVWPNATKMAFSLSDDYLDELLLDLLGKPNMTYPIMLPTDIFRNIGDSNYFTSLITELKNGGYEEGVDLFIFPYDWRLNIVESVSGIYSPLLTSLKDKVDQVLIKTGAEKVDIVAHSMGGLLAKYYIKHFGQDKVDKFVDIATPHLGAPSTFQTLIYGDDLDIVKAGIHLLNPLEIKKISQNMTSAYQLLPSSNYFSASSPDYNYYVYDMDDYDNNGIKGKLTFRQSLDFLKNTGRNEVVMNVAVNIHNDLDNMNPADYGVQAYNIVGCGTPTVGKIFTLGKQTDKDPQYDIAYISGDGTVPQRSAEEFPSLTKYYATGQTHSLMPSVSGIKELVLSLLSGKAESFDLNSYSNISTTTANCKLPNGTFIGLHSPVDLHIYDSAGNHTGPNINGDLEENIPGIAYDIIDGNKFAFLPDGLNYEIKLEATALGSFSSHIKRIEDGEVISTAYFADIPLQSTSTRAEVNISSSTPVIMLDPAGNGQKEKIYTPTASINGDLLTDKVSPEFVLSVDPVVFGLKVSGSDNMSHPSLNIVDVTEKKRNDKKYSYTVTDVAGNSLNMIIEINRESDKKLNYDIQFPNITKGQKIKMNFERALNKDGSLKTFTQNIIQGRDTIKYIYNVKKDKTIIWTRDGKETNKKVYNESVAIQFISNKGLLEIK